MYPDRPGAVYQELLEFGATQYKPITHVPGATFQPDNSTGLFTLSFFIPHNTFLRVAK